MQAPKPRTRVLAIGRWPGILKALGVDPAYLENKHGPCPCCGGSDRYRFDDLDGKGTFFCSKCGPGDGFLLLERLYGWSFSKAASEIDRVLGTVQASPIAAQRDEQSIVDALNSVWAGSFVVAECDPVWRYLNRRTGVTAIPAAIRYHPALRYVAEDGQLLGTFPAMLARLTTPDGKGASIHRTYLTADGHKADVPRPKKLMPGKPLNRAAARLSSPAECLGIAEGIETALAASIRFGVPVWAATTATLLEQWEPPAEVRRILIAGDNDASFTGQAAAYALAKRLHQAGYSVEVQIPPTVGTDWADLEGAEATGNAHPREGETKGGSDAN